MWVSYYAEAFSLISIYILMLGYFTPMLPTITPLVFLPFINTMKMRRSENMDIELETLSMESSLHWSLFLLVAWDMRQLYFTGVNMVFSWSTCNPLGTRILSDYKLVKMPLVLCVVTLCHLMYPWKQVFCPSSCAWATGLISGPCWEPAY